MKNARTLSFLGLLLVAALISLAVACGGGKATGNAEATATVTPEPTATGYPTPTPAPPLPATSTVALVPVTAPPDGDYETALYVADVSTGDTFKVETVAGSVLSPRAWVSPTQLMTYAFSESDHSLYLLDLSTKTLRRLPGSADDSAVSFSHSGGLMTNTTPGGELLIWRVSDGQEVTRLDVGPIGYVLWAPDDKHIYWPGVPSGIASVSPEPHVVPVDTGATDRDVSWFSDGSGVALADAQGIFSFNADSGEKKLLYSWPPGSAVDPSFIKLSPDGKYALSGMGAAGFRALVVPLSGGTEGIQITVVEAEDAQWSPTEDAVATVADFCTPGSRLLLVNADGSIRSTIDSQPWLQIPRFSADGSLIAYVGQGPQEKGMQDQYGITVRKAEGGDSLVSFIAGFSDTEYWSPDGHWLAYTPTLMTSHCVSDLGNTQILPFP